MTKAESDTQLKVWWSRQNQTDDQIYIDGGNSTDDSSKIIPTGDPDDDDDHDRLNPEDEQKIRVGIIVGAIISACIVVTIVACICKKRRDSKNSRAFSSFFADDGVLKH